MDARKLSKKIRLQRGPFRKSRITRCAGAELLAGQVHSCSGGSTRYLMIFVASGGGSVVGGGYYRYGESAEALATPDSGYRFLHWLYNGSIAGTGRNISVFVSNDCIFTAVFVPIADYTIRLETSIRYGAGSLHGAGTFPAGTTDDIHCAELVYVESILIGTFSHWESKLDDDPQAVFEYWTDALRFSHVVDANRTFKACYDSVTFTITTRANYPFITPDLQGGGTWNGGDVVWLRAPDSVNVQGDALYKFQHWSYLYTDDPSANWTFLSDAPNVQVRVLHNCQCLAMFVRIV